MASQFHNCIFGVARGGTPQGSGVWDQGSVKPRSIAYSHCAPGEGNYLQKGTPVIVEGKIKPETYTADGVEHKTFSVKADYLRKIDYAAPSEANKGNAAKPAKKKAK